MGMITAKQKMHSFAFIFASSELPSLGRIGRIFEGLAKKERMWTDKVAREILAAGRSLSKSRQVGGDGKSCNGSY